MVWIFPTIDVPGSVASVATEVPISALNGIISVDAPSVQEKVNVGNASKIILPANPHRRGGWIRNISDQIVFLFIGDDAQSTQPTILYQGESFKLSGDGYIIVGDVYAMHTGTGGKEVEVIEV